MLKLGYVGGLGAMASPAAAHLKNQTAAQILRVHDRGVIDPIREQRREAWRSYGAEFVSHFESLIGSGDLDGVVVCAGKNGDDLPIVAELIERGSRFPARDSKFFVLHLSTVSTSFVIGANKFAVTHGVHYVNYPLTGGPRGASLGGGHEQGMLILAGGEKEIFERVLPFLRFLGHPRHFGDSPIAGTLVKLIGHFMVFCGCLGISSAASLYSACFCEGQIGGEEQSKFFDFLNKGAGGTRQWDVALSRGIRDGNWHEGFFIHHAVVDALYAACAAEEAGVSPVVVEPLLLIACGFSFLFRKYPNEHLATHAIMREFVGAQGRELNYFVQDCLQKSDDFFEKIRRIEASLPLSIQRAARLNVEASDFSRFLAER